MQLRSTIAHAISLPASLNICLVAVGISLVSAGQVAHAAIPLLDPCDPDFRSGSGCSPGTTKVERPPAPAAPAKAPKSATSPATVPATVPAPLKTAPAAKSPGEQRPDSMTQVSLPAEENCPKLQRAELGEESGPLVTVSLTISP